MIRNKMAIEDIWILLSQIFISTGCDYKTLALQLARNTDLSIDNIEANLFEKVAPICAPSAMNPEAPPISIFERTWLIYKIHELEEKQLHSSLNKIHDKWKIFRYKSLFGLEWRELKHELLAQGVPKM